MRWCRRLVFCAVLIPLSAQAIGPTAPRIEVREAVQAALVFGVPQTDTVYLSGDAAVAVIAQNMSRASNGRRRLGPAYECPRSIAGSSVSQYGELWGVLMSYCADLTDQDFPNNDGPVVVVSGNPACPFDSTRSWRYEVVSHRKEDGLLRLRVRCSAPVMPMRKDRLARSPDGRECMPAVLRLSAHETAPYCFIELGVLAATPPESVSPTRSP